MGEDDKGGKKGHLTLEQRIALVDWLRARDRNWLSVRHVGEIQKAATEDGVAACRSAMRKTLQALDLPYRKRGQQADSGPDDDENRQRQAILAEAVLLLATTSECEFHRSLTESLFAMSSSRTNSSESEVVDG